MVAPDGQVYVAFSLSTRKAILTILDSQGDTELF